MLPIGVNTWVWTSPLTDAALARLAPHVAGLGFDVIELPVEQPGQWDPHAAADLLQGLGLAASVVLVMPPGRELVAASPETIHDTQEYLRHCVDVAAVVGAPAISGPAYASVGRTWQLGRDERKSVYAELRENLKPVLDHAAGRGVRIGVEPLNRYETSLINTVEQALDALPVECGLALDTYHLNIEERSPDRAVRAAGERIVHLQVCGTDRGAPGGDHFDWPGFAAAVNDSGYLGPLVIESFTPDNTTIATAASIWRPLAQSPDALAADGLAFLKSL
ncbi:MULTISPECIES: sugar phosphate isomerase/epimerase family protein [unclassified Streptomyces]|uniref:sugar phosphate isomerase/epimerase family protein n=1 Tax=unclassified Streptomyces TaxID=2593676 RepID=UPI002259D864|nr:MULTISPECIES: sugar phosphate isomerase/epimerase family protein [unclassified Streptomyces]MCX5126790.1 sugar phosphate isomerase/epimerase [Streptomyces sp. NBC_00347]WSP36711.1 sugar phosphate isomerase/epimerase [Streptomyces sp. NBC_01244]